MLRVFGEMPADHTHSVLSSFQRFPFLIGSLDSSRSAKPKKGQKSSLLKMETLENLNFPFLFFTSHIYNRWGGDPAFCLKTLEKAAPLSFMSNKEDKYIGYITNMPPKYE